ncbi:MAG: primosomal protein N' [Betaproteobacteria bacterium]|nr:primosomal protein N' [Betaproteobacteria bacterium]
MNARLIARVALDVPRSGLFDFALPDATDADIGRLAIVPWGPRESAAVILDITSQTDVPAAKLRMVAHVHRDWPALSAADLALFRFCAGYYHHALGPVILNAVPPRLRSARPLVSKPSRLFALTPAGHARLAEPGRARALHRVLEDVAAGLTAEETLRARHAGWSAKAMTLIADGLVEARPIEAEMPARHVTLVPGPALNADQRAAAEAIDGAAGQFATLLLDGVTGSGKTEVYLQAMARALARGAQVLVLMPEINLTPQFLQHLATRLEGARVTALHSALNATERCERFLDAALGRSDVVIGTRLAVFTPMPRLGLVIVDEEHDASFKQQEGLRYSARDVAVVRAKQLGCPVVLGSATPSLETLANAARGRCQTLHLPVRANPAATLPKIELVDLEQERVRDGLSARMIDAVRETLAQGEQALLFINRRGFAPALVCTQCGHIPQCRRCSARLVFHRGDRRLKCHHCGDTARVPEACEECKSIVVVAMGEGTERIEGALARLFPEARIARADRDTVRRRGDMERFIERVRAREVDLLVGTQMLSKGHDFPQLTLAGVINADGAMFSADFRASERLVAQLMQVAGRAGRAERPGRVLIQTRFVQHPFYRAVVAHDYAGFAQLALEERRAAHLPPFARLALLRAEGRDAARVEQFMLAARASAQQVQASIDGAQRSAIDLWDPVPATLARKAGFERRQLMVQSASRTALQSFLAQWMPALDALKHGGVRWIVDVDPIDI